MNRYRIHTHKTVLTVRIRSIIRLCEHHLRTGDHVRLIFVLLPVNKGFTSIEIVKSTKTNKQVNPSVGLLLLFIEIVVTAN